MHMPPPTMAHLMAIPDGKRGTLQTLKIMRQLTRQGKKSLAVRQLALSIVRRNNGKDWVGEVRNVQRWVKRNIRYVKDIRGVETVHTPEKMIEIRQGDCDDQAILVASLLESIGHPTRFAAVGFMPGSFSHVYAETKIGNKWFPVETTEPWPLGKGPKNVISKLVVYN